MEYVITCKVEEAILTNNVTDVIDKTEEIIGTIPFLQESRQDCWRLAWGELFNKLDLLMISVSTISWDIMQIEMGNHYEDSDVVFIYFKIRDRSFKLTLRIFAQID